MKVNPSILIRAVLPLFTFLIALNLHAQQDPQFSQVSSLRFAFNPAVAGSNEQICAVLDGRQQWTGFTNHPTTTVLSVNAPVIDLHGGAGINVFADKLGQESTLIVQLAYAYRVRLGDGMLSAGLGLGLIQKSLRAKFNIPIDQIQIDDFIPENGVSDNALDVGGGMFYQNDDQTFYAGISTTRASEPTLELETLTKTTRFAIGRHYYFIAGYVFRTRVINVLPSVWYRTDGVKGQVETTLKVDLGNGIRVGASYRHKDAVAPVAEFSFAKGIRTFKVGYAYDITLNRLRSASFGSHELLLGLCQPIIKKQKKWKNPRSLGPYNYF